MKSPVNQMEAVDLGAEDYDEETDEFAGYSGSNAHLFAKDSEGHSVASANKDPEARKQHLASSKASSSSKKSSQ